MDNDAALDNAPDGALWLPSTSALNDEDYAFEGLPVQVSVEVTDDDELLVQAAVIYTDEPADGERDLAPVRLYLRRPGAAAALIAALADNLGLPFADAQAAHAADRQARQVASQMRDLAGKRTGQRHLSASLLGGWVGALQNGAYDPRRDAAADLREALAANRSRTVAVSADQLRAWAATITAALGGRGD